MATTSMKSYIVPVSQEGDLQFIIPESVGKEFGLEGVKAIALLLDDGEFKMIPLRKTLEEVKGSVSLGPHSIDFDDEIAEAIEEYAREKYG